MEAELVIVNVINSRPMEILDRVGAGDYGLTSGSYRDTVKSQRIEVFDRDYLPRCQDLRCRVVFRSGVPYEQILKVVEQERADMVCMGTKGRSNLSGALFGSTAEKVFRHAPCLVLSVRGPEHCRLT
jgi:nucleotide-binding universal stress UspA family protein